MKKVVKFFTEGTLKTIEEMTTAEKQAWIETIENRMKTETFEPNQKNNKKLLKILRG